ncbi:hypothetical protein K7I13_05715 [Brucepastera parasyntrophica]|uniref:hypothetical protein n=1 Tax=Brucepastera parasyntrophica TaxID=2880008 RepID=UPI00210BA772|nr:hypothetical protein [Brucepastera parasyntrophica]ULQ60765.1 hypothetical protein K7I13_05715 [Brucepastera parasyntrophica]
MKRISKITMLILAVVCCLFMAAGCKNNDDGDEDTFDPHDPANLIGQWVHEGTLQDYMYEFTATADLHFSTGVAETSTWTLQWTKKYLVVGSVIYFDDNPSDPEDSSTYADSYNYVLTKTSLYLEPTYGDNMYYPERGLFMGTMVFKKVVD